MYKILLIEDAREVYNLVKMALGNGLELSWVSTIQEAQEVMSQKLFDLILLDIQLPDGSGIDFCYQVQSSSPETPIFMLTSHTDLSEKVLGFSAGADDYITKPFAPLELKARVEAKLRKVDLKKQTANILKWNEIEIDKNRQEVKVHINGEPKPIELTALEFKLLTYFANRPGHVVHRDEMLNDIWGEEVHVYPRSVDTHVSKLRKKLGPVSHIIESVHGTGYKFTPTTQMT